MEGQYKFSQFSPNTLLEFFKRIPEIEDTYVVDVFTKKFVVYAGKQYNENALVEFEGETLEQKLKLYKKLPFYYGDVSTVLGFFDFNNRDSDSFAWWDQNRYYCDIVISRLGTDISYIHIIPLAASYELASYSYRCYNQDVEILLFALYSYFSSRMTNKRRYYSDDFFKPFGLLWRCRT